MDRQTIMLPPGRAAQKGKVNGQETSLNAWAPTGVGFKAREITGTDLTGFKPRGGTKEEAGPLPCEKCLEVKPCPAHAEGRQGGSGQGQCPS